MKRRMKKATELRYYPKKKFVLIINVLKKIFQIYRMKGG